ncbi:hypothetical protein NCS13_1_0437 [Neochlamydia sp. S13]|nr:hypothetical protein NCS13_1_0437 [Neochlamydia sp. S13]
MKEDDSPYGLFKSQSDYDQRKNVKLMIINGLAFTLGLLHESIQELILSLDPTMRHVLLVLVLFGRN